MDKFSEIEAKFAADGLLPSLVQKFVDGLVYSDSSPLRAYPDHYREVKGTDFFYRVGGKVVRLRRDVLQHTAPPLMNPSHADVESVCLTIKERKSQKSLLDRHEVDLFVEPENYGIVVGFLKMLGGKLEFRIEKRYWVWLFRYLLPFGQTVEICLAMYDVSAKGKPKRRFLEVEIEKHSTVSPKVARQQLQWWISTLKKEFSLEAPINASLQELYRPKKKR